MTTVAHSTLTGSDLHENKGAAAATDNTVATAVSGATVWAKLTASNLTGTGNAFGAQLLHVQDQKSSGTQGGALSSSTWTTHVLNTTLTNEISSATLTSNVISLPAGTYWVDAHSVVNLGNESQMRFRDTTSNTTLARACGVRSGASDGTTGAMRLSGRFTLSGTKNVELQMWVATGTSGNGLGYAASSGDVEMYADVKVWKIA